MPENVAEQRHTKRTRFASQVTLTKGNDCWSTRLVDVSLRGLLVEEPENWSRPTPGEPLELALELGGDVRIEMTVLPMRYGEGQIGFEWTNIDPESLEHLRRLLELNLGDPDEVRNEVRALSGRTA